jgi:hypothetical protein
MPVKNRAVPYPSSNRNIAISPLSRITATPRSLHLA